MAVKSSPRPPAVVLRPGPGYTPDKGKPRSRSPRRGAKDRRERVRKYSSSSESDRSEHKEESSTSSDSSSGGALIPAAPKWFKHTYGAASVPTENWDQRPRALLLFSGKSRDGDLASYLVRSGWIDRLYSTTS